MNFISQNLPASSPTPPEVCEFATVEELMATPLVRSFTERPEITSLLYGGGFLMALDSRGPYLCVVGILKDPVRFPQQIARTVQT